MSEDAKETKRGNRIARAALQVTCILSIAGWMFSVERNTARTATATEFFKTRLPVIEVIFSENREGLTKATTRLDSHDKRLDDHQRVLDTINKGDQLIFLKNVDLPEALFSKMEGLN